MDTTIPTTSSDLLIRMRKAVAKEVSGQDCLEQRVSFVYGCLGFDNELSKHRIRQIILGL